jgi:lipopolysaccharide transport system permease protein
MPEATATRRALSGCVRLARLMYLRELVVHLTRRELSSTYRDTLLGWTWPLARQLVQLAVLVFVFSKVVNLKIPHYPAFVFSGLVAWSWFSSGIVAASTSIIGNRHFGLRPGFPVAALPIIAISVALFDAMVALPILLALVIAEGNLSPQMLLLVPCFLVQFVLMAGIAWLVGSVSVYLRDVPNVVTVFVLLGFYVTPIYFEVTRVPAQYRWILNLNPAALLVESDRASLLGTPWPPTAALVVLPVVSALLAVLGYRAFRRMSRSFADEL